MSNNNSFENLLIELGLSDDKSVYEFHPKVRDTDLVKVMKCRKSGVLFLNNNEHASVEYYQKLEGFAYWNKNLLDKKLAIKKEDSFQAPIITSDDYRRMNQFSVNLQGKTWLDFGCGSGGLLRLTYHLAKEAMGLEIQKVPKEFLNQEKIKCVSELSEIENNSLELITLFHSFEHLANPIETLQELSKKLVVGGQIIIEVPQANDILISFFNLSSFKSFTFWSEHLILHTKESLGKFIMECDDLFVEQIQGFQRYPFSNHLYWLFKSLPGGHEKWSFLNNSFLNLIYSKILQTFDKTDTLIAYVRKKA